MIQKYSKALELIENYDNNSINKIKGTNNKLKINYEDCISIINSLKYDDNKLFALERKNGLKSILNDIYQTFDGKDLYNLVE